MVASLRRIGTPWRRVGRFHICRNITTCLRTGWWWFSRIRRESNWLGRAFSLLHGRCVSNNCRSSLWGSSSRDNSCPQSIAVPADCSNTHPKSDTDAYRDEDWKNDEDDEGNYSSCNNTTNYRMIGKESEITSSATDICLQHEMTFVYRQIIFVHVNFCWKGQKLISFS